MSISYSPLYRLSNTASERGTAYIMSNKSLTLGDRTFVVWTDRDSVTMGNVFHHADGTWAAPTTLGIGADNHNSPCLGADAEGRLRIAFGPHGVWSQYPDAWTTGTFKYLIGDKPCSFEGMRESTGERFGYRATYASLMHVPPGVDCLVYRGGEHPPSLMFQRRTERGGWTNAVALMAQDIDPQYTYYGAMLTADTRGRIYAAGAFYAMERKHSLGVSVLMSDDLGKTWTDLSGRSVDLPAGYDSRLAIPHSEPETDPRLNGLTVDPSGRLWALTCSRSIRERRLLLSRWASGAWKTTDAAAWMPEAWVPIESHMTIDCRGGIHLAVVALPIDARRDEPDPLANWGHPSSEIFHMVSTDGGDRFACHQISETDPGQPNWLPAISLNGPYHPVEHPAILFTHGSEPDHTEIYCRFLEQTGG